MHVLTVLDEFESKIVPITGEQEALRDEHQEQGEEVVREVAKAAEQLGVPAETEVKSGVVHEQIESYVEANDIGLVVMGSRGLLNSVGSVADKTIRVLEIPTMVVHRPPESFADLDRDVHLAGW